MPRITAPSVDVIETRAEMEALVGDLSKLQLRQNALKVELDQELLAVRRRYEQRIDALDEQIQEKFRVAENWACAHPEEFGPKKSIEFVHGTVGFRTATPRVAKLGRIKNFAEVVAVMLRTDWAAKYVKTQEPQLNREALIADRKTFTDDQLKQIGIKIVQDERFYVEPKQEALEQGVTT